MRQLSRHLTQPSRSRARLPHRPPTRRSRAHAIAVAALLVLGGGACSKDGASQLRELRDEACACKTRECAAAVGGKLAKLAVDSELDEARAKLAIEATTCLAAHGE
jgi:hypothetical protein